MCGIAGIFEFGASEKTVRPDVLKRMSDVIVRRGPDSDGSFVSGNRECGLAFRRLSIIDLSSDGNQPMSTPDGRYTIVFNGEIYNHLELRADLEKKGYRYRSRTDTETLLYGYAEYGSDLLGKTLGMHAFAVWDEREKELFLARDAVGIKPLYFTRQNGRFVFGSEIKSILAHPKISPEINLDELPNYLNFGMSGNRRSLFKNIEKIPAGHYLKINSKGEIETKRFWSPLSRVGDYTTLSPEEIGSEVLRILRSAIKDRMMSDVPFGVFLSGGVDSSLNVALMHEVMDRPIDTYSVGFKELEKYNELEYARKVAKIFGTNHREILIDRNDALPILSDLVWHEDEPNADPVCMPLWFLSKLTRDSGTTVIQVGEGSDEQFVGYPWMLRLLRFHDAYWQKFNALPGLLKRGIAGVAKPLVNLSGSLLPGDFIDRAAKGYELYWGGMPIFSPSHQRRLLDKSLRDFSEIPAKFGTELHKTALSIKPDADYLQRIAFVELAERLSEILLMRVDKIGMAHSIEARVPFLDKRLIEFTMSIPPNIKAPDNKTTKIVLKKAVEGLLPDEIIYRKKQGFWAPVNEWLRSDWRSLAEEKIYNSSFVKNKIFNRKFIEKMISDHSASKTNQGLQIFSLLTLGLWEERFFGK